MLTACPVLFSLLNKDTDMHSISDSESDEASVKSV